MTFIRRISKKFRPARAVVLMYHRIAEPAVDPWQLAVSTKNFREHIEILSSSGKTITTEHLIENVRNKKIPADCFCITSDDGYQDNFLNAYPVLEELRCPATFFIPSGCIGSGEAYWWDMLADIFLSAKKLPGKLEINIQNKEFSYTLQNEGAIAEKEKAVHSMWHWPAPPPTQRCSIYLELWMHLRDLPSLVISDVIDRLKKWSGVEATNASGNLPMSWQELRMMSTGKYVSTGVHTVTHAALGAFSRPIQETEIRGCKDYLDENLGKEHFSIAFPYGNYNNDTLDIARQTGLKGAFTTDPKPVTAKSDVYQLGRFQVTNQTGEQFKVQLEKWLNN